MTVFTKICPGKMLPDSHLPVLRELIAESDESQRNKEVVWRRWGEQRTLQEIGEMYGLTRERVRQIEYSVARRIFPKLFPYLVDIPPKPQPVPLTLDDLEQMLNEVLQKRNAVRLQFRQAIKNSLSLQFLREYGRYNAAYHRDGSKTSLEARREARRKYRASLSEEARRLQGEYIKLSREVKYIQRAIKWVKEGKAVYHIKLHHRNSSPC